MEDAALTRHLLMALLAPGSVEAEVARLQNSIFSDYGFASAVAISPIIPIAFLPQPIGQAQIRPLAGRAPSPFAMTARGLRWEGGALFLSLETGGLWESLRGAARDAGYMMEQGGPLFPVGEGFFLGCVEASPKEREVIRPAAPRLRFSSCSLALVSLAVPRTGDGWWREVHTEVLVKKVLR
jgi:hypothetical protein